MCVKENSPVVMLAEASHMVVMAAAWQRGEPLCAMQSLIAQKYGLANLFYLYHFFWAEASHTLESAL